MSSTVETSDPAAAGAHKRPVKPPKPAKLTTPISSPLASERKSGDVDTTSTQHESNSPRGDKSVEGDKAAIPPPVPSKPTRSHGEHQQQESPAVPKLERQSSINSDSLSASEEAKRSAKSERNSIDSSSSRAHPAVSLIVLPGTPGENSEEEPGSPIFPPQPDTEAEAGSATTSQSVASSSAASSPATNAKESSKERPKAAPRKMPARPNTLRREHRAATVSGPAPHSVASTYTSEAPSTTTTASDEKPAQAEENKESYATVLKIGSNSPRSPRAKSTPSSPRDISSISSTDQKEPGPATDPSLNRSFDPSSPFGIAEMSETPESSSSSRQQSLVRKVSRPHVQVPIPPKVHPSGSPHVSSSRETSQSVASPVSRQSRSASLADTGSKRVIPVPPSTTPAKVAPPVVLHHQFETEAEREEREAEKRARSQRKEYDKMVAEKQERRERDLSASDMEDSHSEAASSSSVTGASSMPSTSPVASPPITLPVHIHHDITESTVVSPRKTPSAELKKSKDKPPKEVKEIKDKEKEKEKEKEKDKEKEHGGSGVGKPGKLLSKLTDKLKGKSKHNKDDDHSSSASKHVTIAEGDDSDSDSAPADPLLAKEALTPAVTPREGAIGEGCDATSTGLEGAPHALYPPKQDVTEAEIAGLEAHKAVLSAQIKDMEDLHRRLMEAIALDQQALQDTRGGKKSNGSSKSSPSPSRKTGHSPTSSTTGGNTLSPPATSPSTSPLTRARKLILQTSPQFNAASPIEWNTKYDGPIQECFGFKQKLSEASLGAVYVSQVVKSGTNVALRIIKKDSSISVDDHRAIMTQLKELKKLSSPRIAAILGVFDADSEIWIASQYCPIGSLRSLLSNHLHTLSEEQIRPVLRSTLVGLNTLHLSNIAHGSVRLTNILVDSVADVKLCDYGLHNLVKSFSTQKMLPHLVSNLVQAPSIQGDIWGLGVALIEMSEGRSSVESNMDAPVLSNPAKHSEEFNDFVNRCLSATTANPPPTCEELLSHPFLKVNVSSQSLIDAIAIALASARSGHSDSEASSPSPARSRQEVDDIYSRRSPGSHSHTRQQSSNSEDETSAKVRIAIRPSSGSAESFNALTGSSEVSDMDSSAEGPLKEASSRSSISDERSIAEAPHRATEQTIALLQRLITERYESALDGASDETKAVIASFSQAVIKLTEETLHGAAKQL